MNNLSADYKPIYMIIHVLLKRCATIVDNVCISLIISNIIVDNNCNLLSINMV